MATSLMEKAFRQETQWYLESLIGNGFEHEFDWVEKLYENKKLLNKVCKQVAEEFINDCWIWERINDSLDYYINDNDEVIKLKGEE